MKKNTGCIFWVAFVVTSFCVFGPLLCPFFSLVSWCCVVFVGCPCLWLFVFDLDVEYGGGGNGVGSDAPLAWVRYSKYWQDAANLQEVRLHLALCVCLTGPNKLGSIKIVYAQAICNSVLSVHLAPDTDVQTEG